MDKIMTITTMFNTHDEFVDYLTDYFRSTNDASQSTCV
jgi:hypothetical protein